MKEEKRIDPQSKARLRWFLDFLYTDFDSLSRSEFLKFLIDLRDIVCPYAPDWFTGESDFVPLGDYPQLRREIKGYQEHLKRLLKSILHTGKRRSVLKTDDGQKLYYHEPYDVGSIEMTLKITVFDNRIALTTTEPKDALAAEFANSLKPFSLHDIRKCERKDCGRHFLKATKKEKRYCSNKCAWVMASRKRREANSEKKGRRDKGGKR